MRSDESSEVHRLLTKVVPTLLASQAPKARKFERLVEIADKAFAAIAPSTPCKRGCSHCCHIAVAISDSEAKRIGDFLGVTPVQQPHAGQMLPLAAVLKTNIARYSLVPCTFLNPDGSCSIYPIRPIACRTHHTIAADATCCDLKLGKQDVPQVNLSKITTAAARVCLSEAFGDIRAYFPRGIAT